MMTYRSKCLALATAIAGCAMAGSGNAQDAGTVVPEGEMTTFCQSAAAERFNVQLDAITTDPPVRREGKILVLGTIDDTGTDNDGGFDCRFEEDGTFINVIGAPGD